MGRMKNCIKRLLLMLCVLGMMATLCGFDENGQKVYDNANLFTDAEEEQLTQMAVEMAKELSLDVIICTTNSTGGSSIDDYADDFYKEHGFGYDGKNGAGVMLVINMGQREVFVHESRLEDVDFLFLDSELDAIYDDVSPYLTKEDYYGGAVRFIRLLTTYADDDGVSDAGAYDGSGRTKYSIEGRAEGGTQWLPRAVIAVIIATIAVLVMHFNQKSKKVTNPHVYMRDDRLDLREHSDIYTHTTTVRHRIEREGGGGGRIGGSHSGGGSHSHGRGGHF